MVTFGKMRGKEKPKKNEGNGGEKGREGQKGWVSFVAPEFASNIYATPATMGTISVAWQPLCSRPVLPSTPSVPHFHSIHCPGSLPNTLPPSFATNSFSPRFLVSPLYVAISLGSIFHPRTSLAEGQRRTGSDRRRAPSSKDGIEG